MAYDQLQDAARKYKAELSSRIKDCQAGLKAVNGILKALEGLPQSAVALGEAVNEFRKRGQAALGQEEYDRLLSGLEGAAKQELDQASFTFRRDLREALKEVGVELGGNVPKLIAEPLLLEVDTEQRRVVVKFGHETLSPKPLPLNPARVVAAYSEEKRKLTEQRKDLEDFKRLLFEAYRRLIVLSGKKEGDRVSLVDCYREVLWLKQPPSFPKKSVEYSRAFFAYDLRQLQHRGLLTHQNRRLNLGTATIKEAGNDRLSMWVPRSADDGEYLKDIYWKTEVQ